MEAQQVEVGKAAVAAFYDELEAMIERVPATMIYKADETGCSDWVDAHEIRVLVPVPYPGSSIAVPVDRHSKIATLPGCIAADGSTIRPMTVT
jgi:hypothetical protein